MERTCRRVRMRRASAAFPKGYHGCDRERFDRLVRACCAMTEQLQAPFEGVLELDETTFGGARKGKRGWCAAGKRSEEHTSELQSLMRISYAVFCLKQKNKN